MNRKVNIFKTDETMGYWLSQKSDYYSIDDELPKYQKRWGGAF